MMRTFVNQVFYRLGFIIDKSWGNKFIDNLARDIKIAYPNSAGYSVRNLKHMAKFATEYPDQGICANGICTNSLVA